MSVESILAELKKERDRIDQAIRALSTIATTKSPPGGARSSTKRRGRRKLSAEARKRIADAQRKRWAEQKAKK